MAGQRISEPDRERIDPWLICPVCMLLVSLNPVQTPCCLICYECLNALFRIPNRRCPLHGTVLTNENVNGDNFRKRELMSLHLHCPNDDCDWSGTYGDLQHHGNVCPGPEMNGIVGNELFIAIGGNRQETCARMAARVVGEQGNVGREEPVFMAVGNGHIQGRRQILNVILYLWTKFQNLHLNVDLGTIMRIGKEKMTQFAQFVWRMVTELLVERIGNLEERVRLVAIQRLHVERDGQILRLRERLDLMGALLAKLTARLSDVEGQRQTQAMTSFNGTLLWRIDDFSRKRRDAVSVVQTAIYSQHFYTSQFGYKMCARIYLNGDGFGKETHISLFFVVMKGEYDALLPWPFQKKITMMMLDQNNGDHMIDAFRSDPESSSFQRPTNNMNIASGSPLFMPLDGLNNRAYVKDDTMFIKIIVD